MTQHTRLSDADGSAALGICESLLLALTELKVFSETDVAGLLEDVAAAHRGATATSTTPEKHQAVVALVERILAGKDGVRE